jgi:hypothetical protein
MKWGPTGGYESARVQIDSVCCQWHSRIILQDVRWEPTEDQREYEMRLTNLEIERTKPT